LISKKTLIRILFGFIGLGVLYWTISIYGVENYVDIFIKASPLLLLLAVIFPALEELSASFQLHEIYRSTNIKISFKDMFWINQWGSFLGDIQKGVGVLVAIDSISLKSGISHVESTTRYSLYYATNIVIRAFATTVGLIYFMNILPSDYKSLSIIVIIIFSILSVGLVATVFGSKSIKLLITSTLGKVPLIGIVINNMVKIEVHETKLVIFKLFILGLFNWTFASLQWYVISYAIGYPLDYWFCMSAISILSLPKLIPFIPSALGVYDVVIMAGLGTVSVPAFAGLSFAMIERITDIVSNSIAVLKPEYLRFFNDIEKVKIDV